MSLNEGLSCDKQESTNESRGVLVLVMVEIMLGRFYEGPGKGGWASLSATRSRLVDGEEFLQIS